MDGDEDDEEQDFAAEAGSDINGETYEEGEGTEGHAFEDAEAIEQWAECSSKLVYDDDAVFETEADPFAIEEPDETSRDALTTEDTEVEQSTLPVGN